MREASPAIAGQSIQKNTESERQLSKSIIPLNHLSTAMDMPLALFLLSALGGLWAAYDRTLSWPMLITIVLSIAIYHVIISIGTSSSLVQKLALCGILSSLTIAIYFVTQSGHLEYPQKLMPINRLRELSRTFPQLILFRPHPNSVATFLEGWLPLAVAMTIEAKHRGARILTGTCAAILALAILLSASRGAWLGLALSFAVWWATYSRRNAILTTCCGLTLILVIGGYLISVSGASLEDVSIVNQTLVPLFARPDRIAVYRGSWYLIQDFPFTGIGLGNTFAMMYSRYALLIQVPFLTYSHNLFLQVWLNQGLLGIIAFAWLIAAFFGFIWRVGRRSNGLFQGAWLGVAVILLHGLSDARQYADGWTLPPLFALMGLAMAARPKSAKAQAPKRSLVWKAGGATVAGILAITLALARQPLAAKAYANAGALSQARSELSENLSDEQRNTWLKRAASYYNHAIALDQSNRTANQRLGVLAMEAQQMDNAVAYLEAAYQANPTNTTTHKALGLAYTWTGRLDQAERLLADAPDIVEELNVWGGWWIRQGKSEWATNAYRVSLLLKPDQPSIKKSLAAIQEN